MKKYAFSLVLGLLFFSNIVCSQAAEPYTLRPGDSIEISVVNKMGVTTHTADVDGKFTMGMIGIVDVSNKTVNSLKEELTVRLSEYIKDPEVVINIKGYGNMKVNVLGEVKSPGTHGLTKGYSLVDAIARAGGFNKKAAKRRVICIHAGENKPYAIVNVQDILRGKANAYNPELQAEDIIYVESNKKIKLF